MGETFEFRGQQRARRSPARRFRLPVWFPLAALVVLSGAGYLALGVGAPQVADLVGRATVIDGDTIQIRGERVRINGVDAPESRQLCQDASGNDYRCGAVAANALADFLAASGPTRCEFEGRDRYRRFLGKCYRQDGASVASWLVRNGHAVDYTRYSKGAYLIEQQIAWFNGRGIWRGDFEAPSSWRAARR